MSREAVLFAGGKSSRMGRDKALLPFANSDSLALYQYRRLQAIFDRVYISTKSDKFDFEAELIYDRYETSSPLVGIVSMFERLSCDELFVLSVDAPFVNQQVIERLYCEAETKSDIIVAHSPLGLEPLCAIYRRSLLPQAKELLLQNNHRLQSLLHLVRTQEVWFEDEKLFTNLNHPEEYEAAYLDMISSFVKST